MGNIEIPALKDIQDAYKRIESYIHRTPVMQSTQLNSVYGAELFFKCENLQKVGAFKYRGATNAILSLSDEQRTKGVITHSSGNHAAAISLAARKAGIKAYIVVPTNSSGVKKAAITTYGAELSYCEPTLAARKLASDKIIEETGATFIHPYDNLNVICGQGTATLELLQDYKDLDIIICPVGGGGLLSGTVTAAKGLKPEIKVYAGEPLGADDASRSFHTGVHVKEHKPETIADGLLTTLSDRTFKIIREQVDDIFTVDEDTIIESMRMLWERMKIVVEPSSATALGAIAKNPDVFRNKKVGVILSGGNIDLDRLPFNH